MWYHIYTIYFLLSVVITLVIITMIFTKDTTIRVLYNKTSEDNGVITAQFDDGLIMESIELTEEDEIVIATDTTGAFTTFNITYILGNTADSSIIYDKVTSTQISPIVKLHVPRTRNDYALRYTGGTTAELEFIEIHSSTGLFGSK